MSYDVERRKIFFEPNSADVGLEPSNASSMVAEILPLVLYLRHIIPQGEQHKADLRVQLNQEANNNGVLLIIEEPEAHVHPEVQIKLMEVLIKLILQTNMKVKLMLTTHSDTMLDKLSNALIKGEIGQDRVQIQHLVMGPKGSYDAGDMTPTTDGIEDNNFTEAMNTLFNERADAFRKQEAAE